MATLKDVAQLARVSTATVSNVLNGRKRFSAAVEERVWAAARELGYYRNDSARTLRTGQSRTLGLILPDLQNPFFPALVRNIEHRAREGGYSLLLVDIDNEEETEREGFHLLARKGVDGVIWVPHRLERPPAVPYPVVAVDRPVPGLDSVFADHEEGARQLARYALQLNHRSIGFLPGPQSLVSARRRREAFLAELQLAGESRARIAWEIETPFDLQLPAAVIPRFTSGEATLVVAANDIVAIAALELLQANGIQVPEEVSVLGFDDIPWASLVRPRLTTVRQPIGELGRVAVDTLVARIDEPEGATIERVLGVELVTRESAGVRPVLEAAS